MADTQDVNAVSHGARQRPNIAGAERTMNEVSSSQTTDIARVEAVDVTTSENTVAIQIGRSSSQSQAISLLPTRLIQVAMSAKAHTALPSCLFGKSKRLDLPFGQVKDAIFLQLHKFDQAFGRILPRRTVVTHLPPEIRVLIWKAVVNIPSVIGVKWTTDNFGETWFLWPTTCNTKTNLLVCCTESRREVKDKVLLLPLPDEIEYPVIFNQDVDTLWLTGLPRSCVPASLDFPMKVHSLALTWENWWYIYMITSLLLDQLRTLGVEILTIVIESKHASWEPRAKPIFMEPRGLPRDDSTITSFLDIMRIDALEAAVYHGDWAELARVTRDVLDIRRQRELDKWHEYYDAAGEDNYVWRWVDGKAVRIDMPDGNWTEGHRLGHNEKVALADFWSGKRNISEWTLPEIIFRRVVAEAEHLQMQNTADDNEL